MIIHHFGLIEKINFFKLCKTYCKIYEKRRYGMILGLTGGIASGKSTVSKIFLEMGIKVIDADEISRKVSETSDVLQELVNEFGDEIIYEGRLNRRKLRNLVFQNRDTVLKINAIMHPRIIKRIKKEIVKNSSEPLLVLDIPLLYEADLNYLCEKVLLVYVDEKTQVKRVMERDHCSEEEAFRIIEKQMPLSQKKKLADYCIDNSGGLKELHKNVEKFYHEIVK